MRLILLKFCYTFPPWLVERLPSMSSSSSFDSRDAGEGSSEDVPLGSWQVLRCEPRSELCLAEIDDLKNLMMCDLLSCD
jgi:hypothetical protein